LRAALRYSERMVSGVGRSRRLAMTSRMFALTFWAVSVAASARVNGS